MSADLRDAVIKLAQAVLLLAAELPDDDVGHARQAGELADEARQIVNAMPGES